MEASFCKGGVPAVIGTENLEAARSIRINI